MCVDTLRSSTSTDSTTPTTSQASSKEEERVSIARAVRDTGPRLTVAALVAQNASPVAQARYWEKEEDNRIERLIKASRELGFELPRRCY
jgi:5-enolpyruvylshikimate-3-phosphate synthase